jgi:hypothetical protein
VGALGEEATAACVLKPDVRIKPSLMGLETALINLRESIVDNLGS